METPALFPLPEEPEAEPQACDQCLGREFGSDDSLRVRGWGVFDGFSFTGKPLSFRICPACRRGK